MQQYETSIIKRRPDGSINTIHYINIGRQERAEQAQVITKGMFPKQNIFSIHFWSFRALRA